MFWCGKRYDVYGLIASECDIMLVVGTSAVVEPASIIPVTAKKSGSKVIDINLERKPLTCSVSDYLIMGKAGEVINSIIAELESLQPTNN